MKAALRTKTMKPDMKPAEICLRSPLQYLPHPVELVRPNCLFVGHVKRVFRRKASDYPSYGRGRYKYASARASLLAGEEMVNDKEAKG